VKSPRQQFYSINIGLPLLVALGVLVVFDLTGLDVAISNLLYTPATHTFWLEHNKLFEDITHRWARIIPNWTGEAAMIGTLLSFLWPRLKAEKHKRLIAFLERTRIASLLTFCTRHRRDFFFLVVAFAITTGVIHYFKSHTSIYCPIELTQYGGTMDKKEWFKNFSLFREAGEGRCWPGGHASSGFTLLALYFIARRYRWRHARTLLYWTLLLGLVYGTTRVLQGWHFMSHTFWAGIIVWFSALFTALLFYGRTVLQRPTLTDNPTQNAYGVDLCRSEFTGTKTLADLDMPQSPQRRFPG
jgi:membrane-associated PAP2 superfamily phosphatase